MDTLTGGKDGRLAEDELKSVSEEASDVSIWVRFRFLFTSEKDSLSLAAFADSISMISVASLLYML